MFVYIVHVFGDLVIINFNLVKYDFDVIYESFITRYFTRFHPVFDYQLPRKIVGKFLPGYLIWVNPWLCLVWVENICRWFSTTLMSSKVCLIIIFWLLYLFNRSLLMLIIFCLGKVTYRSFMSNVVILYWLLIWMLLNLVLFLLNFCWRAYMAVVLIGWFFIRIFGKPIWWCLYVIYYWSFGSIFFIYFHQGIKFCAMGYILIWIFVVFWLLLCYICVPFVGFVF